MAGLRTAASSISLSAGDMFAAARDRLHRDTEPAGPTIPRDPEALLAAIRQLADERDGCRGRLAELDAKLAAEVDSDTPTLSARQPYLAALALGGLVETICLLPPAPAVTNILTAIAVAAAVVAGADFGGRAVRVVHALGLRRHRHVAGAAAVTAALTATCLAQALAYAGTLPVWSALAVATGLAAALAGYHRQERDPARAGHQAERADLAADLERLDERQARLVERLDQKLASWRPGAGS